MTAPIRLRSLPRVVILNDASVARGGATGLALLSAKLLRARGHEVTFVSGDGGDGGGLEALGVRLISLKGKALLKRGAVEAARSGLSDPAMREAVSRVVAEIDTPETVYHLHGWAQVLSPSVFKALAPVAKRTFLHAHDYFLACPNGAYFEYPGNRPCTRTPLGLGCVTARCDRRSRLHKIWRLARHTQVKAGLAASNWAGVFALHAGMVDGLVRGGLQRDLISVIRNPAERWSATRIRAERNVELCYVGRSSPGKGVALLCRAARVAGLPLRVIGSVEDRADLVRDHPEVNFVGWTAREEIAAQAANARILVMPSRFPEPFGLVAAEASLTGLPIAISDRAVLAGDVAARALGTAVDVSNPIRLAQGLLGLHGRSDAEIEAVSRRAFAGDAALAQTPSSWIDQMCGRYETALGVAA